MHHNSACDRSCAEATMNRAGRARGEQGRTRREDALPWLRRVLESYEGQRLFGRNKSVLCPACQSRAPAVIMPCPPTCCHRALPACLPSSCTARLLRARLPTVFLHCPSVSLLLLCWPVCSLLSYLFLNHLEHNAVVE